MRYFVLDASPAWRLTPVLSPTYPKLASAGAWSPQERFTPADVAELVRIMLLPLHPSAHRCCRVQVEYARQRGVRVMLEIGRSLALMD